MIRVDKRFVEASAEVLCGKEPKEKDASKYDAVISRVKDQIIAHAIQIDKLQGEVAELKMLLLYLQNIIADLCFLKLEGNLEKFFENVVFEAQTMGRKI